MPEFKVGARDVDCAGRQLHEVVHIATVERQVADLSRVDGGGKLGVFGVHSRHFAGDFHHFTSLPKRHLEISTLGCTCVERDVIVREGLESGRFH